MKRFFHGLALFVILACAGLFDGAAFAGEWPSAGETAQAPRASAVNAARCGARRKARRMKVSAMGRRRVIKRRVVKHQATRRTARTQTTARETTPPRNETVTTKLNPAAPGVVRAAETVTYASAGYTATADGATVRMWYSRAYTVDSPYAYVGRMKLDGEEVHVWMETAGNALASLVTEHDASQLPNVAQMMERFPDGGLGVVVAGPDDFAPPTEPAVEVVEWTEPGR